MRVPQNTLNLQQFSPLSDAICSGTVCHQEKSQKRYITFGAKENFVAQETPDGPTPNPAWL